MTSHGKDFEPDTSWKVKTLLWLSLCLLLTKKREVVPVFHELKWTLMRIQWAVICTPLWSSYFYCFHTVFIFLWS